MKTRVRRRRPAKKARIEIIPLIDIMFFLLASFMLVSLSMVEMRGMKISLPTASSASSAPEQKHDFVTVTVDSAGKIYLEKDEVDADSLYERVKKLHDENAEVRIYIRGDKDALHGEVVTVLDRIRAAGVQKVAFEIKSQTVTAPAVASR
jgi:biopolymer transport protein ExbD